MNKKTIWLLEDDLPTIDVYQIAFKQAGLNLEVVNLGKQALEQVKEMQEGKRNLPDLCLIDLMLPDNINGLEIIKALRTNEKTKQIPSFILTNYTDEEMERLGFDLGTEKHILKAATPPSQLIKIIKERLG